MPAGRSGASQERAAFLRECLQRDNRKWNWESVAADCVAEPELIPHLLTFCTDPETRMQQTAGATLGKIIDRDLEVLVPHVPQMLENLKSDPHDAVKRATMRVLQMVDIPEAIEGEVFDVAMRFVSDFNEPIAIRVFSMTTARRLCERYPSLRHELLPVVREIIESKASPGTMVRSKRELKLLEALEDSDEV